MEGKPSVRGSRPVAVIDVGSSAIRMVVAQIEPDGSFRQLEALQRAVPLGQDSFTQGRISRATINLAIDVLRGYQRVLDPYGVHLVRAVATAAVREAQNRELFVDRIFMATGITVEVISGAEEHRLIYAAVRNAFDAEGLRPDANSILVEVGAGSTELSTFFGGEVRYSATFTSGTIRLRNAVRDARPRAGEEAALLRRQASELVADIERSCALDPWRSFIAVGSDARFAAERVLGPPDGSHVRAVPRRDFLRVARELGRLSPEVAARDLGLPFQDAETLAPALLVCAELLKRTRAASVLVPMVSMRDGLILELAAEVAGKPLTAVDKQIYAAAEALGRHYQYDEAHAERVANLAGALFDALKEEHRLGWRERRLLHVAALLHEIGLFVSHSSHHKHSEYLIQASDIFGIRPDERAVVASVARYHRRALPTVQHPSFAALSREQRAVVSKLAAILRIADALVRGSESLRLFRVEVQEDEVVLHLDGPEDLTLERLAMKNKANLFEEVFGRTVVLRSRTGMEP
jgi:exopolyphosphatase/guanosine-5'-triphosphate,3'-diphosphate pyrophosphatase